MAITWGATKYDVTTGASISFTNDGNFLTISISSTTNNITGVAFDGVAMTEIGTALNSAVYGRYISTWGLVNPSTAGSKNITFTGGSDRYLNIVSVLGVDTGNPYTGLTTSSTTGANPTLSITTTTNGAYAFLVTITENSGSAGTDTTMVLDTIGTKMKTYRSTNVVDTTSITLNVTASSGENDLKGFGINPAASTTVNSGFFSLMK